MKEKSNWKINLLCASFIVGVDICACYLYSLSQPYLPKFLQDVYLLALLLTVIDIFIYWLITDYPKTKNLSKEKRNREVFYQLNWFARRKLGVFLAILFFCYGLIMFWFQPPY